MISNTSAHALDSLKLELAALIDLLPNHKHAKWIQRALEVIVGLAGEEIDRLDWKILSASLQDMERGFNKFYPYRHVRKVTVFGSARTSPDAPEYKMAVDFARAIANQGYMVMTGAGGGIMQAGNEGAGAENSFGLNIQLPFEQGSNPFIAGDPKLIDFKYFFTRKLFMLRESDAIALFPGGFGTQDEAMECLTLCQTGRYGPVPLVLIDRPGGVYWKEWGNYVQRNLVETGLVSSQDSSLYTITDNIDVACYAINSFYLVYHSSRFVGDKFVIRLKSELSDTCLEQLNHEFTDILVKGRIEKAEAFPEEVADETIELPRLALYFNQRDYGRLYELIATINRMCAYTPAAEHPEIK